MERMHRTFKIPWLRALPKVPHELRTAFKEDPRSSPVETTFSSSLRIPSEFIDVQDKLANSLHPVIKEEINGVTRTPFMDHLKSVYRTILVGSTISDAADAVTSPTATHAF